MTGPVPSGGEIEARAVVLAAVTAAAKACYLNHVLLDDECAEFTTALLDALGLEQVGWWRPPYGTFYRTWELNQHAPGWRGGECEPVYRLRVNGDQQ